MSFECVYCRYPKSLIVEVYRKENYTERRRECLSCGLKFTTLEKLKEKILKKNSKINPRIKIKDDL